MTTSIKLQQLIPVIGLVTIVMAVVVWLNGSYLGDHGFLLQTIGEKLQSEPLSQSQRAIISNCIDEAQVGIEAELNQKHTAIKIAFHSLWINGVILMFVGVANRIRGTEQR